MQQNIHPHCPYLSTGLLFIKHPSGTGIRYQKSEKAHEIMKKILVGSPIQTIGHIDTKICNRRDSVPGVVSEPSLRERAEPQTTYGAPGPFFSPRHRHSSASSPKKWSNTCGNRCRRNLAPRQPGGGGREGSGKGRAPLRNPGTQERGHHAGWTRTRERLLEGQIEGNSRAGWQENENSA